jgi:hypothetical protein
MNGVGRARILVVMLLTVIQRPNDAIDISSASRNSNSGVWGDSERVMTFWHATVKNELCRPSYNFSCNAFDSAFLAMMPVIF